MTESLNSLIWWSYSIWYYSTETYLIFLIIRLLVFCLPSVGIMTAIFADADAFVVTGAVDTY